MANYFLSLSRGLGLCCAIAAVVFVSGGLFGNLVIDPLLLALLAGIAFKNVFPRATWHKEGARFAEKTVLEFSVLILGASIFLPQVTKSGAGLFILIISGVIGSMAVAFVVGRVLLKLDAKVAILVGVSNSICGNSAAAVMAPIIGASSAELATVIGISALLGASQIVLLPLLVPIFGLTDYQYGVVAGMAVYAVAQVYAASATVSASAASVATFVKLTRVVLLAPLAVSIHVLSRSQDPRGVSTPGRKAFTEIPFLRYLPWFVTGFIILAILRSIGVISEEQGLTIRDFSRYSFVVAMVAIGMTVDFRDVFKIGARVAVTILSVILFMLLVSIIGVNLLSASSG